MSTQVQFLAKHAAGKSEAEPDYMRIASTILGMTGAGVGAGAGGVYGLVSDPGFDEETGKKKSRALNALTKALQGGAVGGIAGGITPYAGKAGIYGTAKLLGLEDAPKTAADLGRHAAGVSYELEKQALLGTLARLGAKGIGAGARMAAKGIGGGANLAAKGVGVAAPAAAKGISAGANLAAKGVSGGANLAAKGIGAGADLAAKGIGAAGGGAARGAAGAARMAARGARANPAAAGAGAGGLAVGLGIPPALRAIDQNVVQPVNQNVVQPTAQAYNAGRDYLRGVGETAGRNYGVMRNFANNAAKSLPIGNASN
jgi:hypothetical protein